MPPGDSREISTARPKICQTDFASFTPGTSTWRTLFHRYLPIKRIIAKTISIVTKDTNAERAGDSVGCCEANVSVCEYATSTPALTVLAITPPIILYRVVRI